MEIRAFCPDDLEPAFSLVTEVFVGASTLHRALDVTLEIYRDYLRPTFRAMTEEGLSVVAVDDDGLLVGCMIVLDFARAVHAPPNQHPVFGPLSALTSALCAQYRQHCEISAGEVILVDMGAVAHRAAGAGVYQKMRAEVQRFARSRGYRYVVGELSSAATQHVILNRLGHRKLGAS